jgi:glycosyltransferase involved in cell wall biosynthesis
MTALVGRASRQEAELVQAINVSHRTLLLSWGVPPTKTGSAVIVGNLARQFDSGEMVVASELPHGEERAGFGENGPRLAYIAKGWPTTWRGARWWRRFQLPLMIARAIHLCRRFGCSDVVAVFPNEEFLIVGYVTSLLTGSRFFMYMHNTWLENRQGIALRAARMLQPRMFRKAAHVFVMSEGMAELYRAHYPGLRCSPLVHSFTEDVPVFGPPPVPGSPLRLTISGNIYEVCRDATQRFCQALSHIEDTELTFLTATPRSYLAQLGLLGENVLCDTAAQDEVVEKLRRADILVLPHGFTGSYSDVEYQTIFPTRTIEYLISGRPILAHAPPNCYLTRFLKENDCALIVDNPSIEQLIGAIRSLRENESLRAKLVRNALTAAERFQAPKVAGVLRERLTGNNNGTGSKWA